MSDDNEKKADDSKAVSSSGLWRSLIWGDFCGDIQTIIDEYDADIVIVEAAERVDRSSGIINGANAMKENTR